MSSESPSIDRAAAVLGLVTLVVANLIYLAGLTAVMDPMMAMEPFYIDLAHRPLADIVHLDSAWGPLYALWLKPLVAVLDDPVRVYFANVQLLSIGVSVSIYLHLLVTTRRVTVALATALLFLVSDLNVPLPSKVSSFALLVMIVGLSGAQLLPAGARRLAGSGLAVLFAAYARPEMYPAAVCLCVAALWVAWRARSDRRQWGWPIAATVSLLAMAAWWGVPIGKSDRLLIAFREHFAWNWSAWHREWRYYAAVWTQEFGDADSLLAALRHNPSAVAHHLGDNFIGTLKFMLDAGFRHYPVLVSAAWPMLVTAEAWLIAAVMIGALMTALLRTPIRRALIDRCGAILVLYLVAAAFPLSGAIVVYPMAHYLAMPSVLLMLAGAEALATLLPPLPQVGRWAQGGLLLGCLAAVPRPFVLPSLGDTDFRGEVSVARPVVDTIQFVRSLHLPPPVQVLTQSDGIGEMLGSGYREIKLWQKGDQPLESYLRDNDVGMILTLKVAQDSFVAADPLWKRIQYDPESAGFKRLAVPNHPQVGVFVRINLLPPGK